METKHSLYLPPSSAPAIMQCACFVSRKEDTEYSSGGTQGHNLCEDIFWHREPRPHPNLDAYDVEDCQWAADFARDWCKRWPDVAPQTEKHLELRSDDGTIITEGTLDICVAGRGIADYKMAWDYDPGKHWHKPQVGGFYALMEMRASGVESLRCLEIYVKPRKFHEYEVTYSEASAMVEAAVARRDQENAVPQPCDFCGFCAKIKDCSALNERLQSVMARYAPVDFEAVRDPGAIADPEVMGRVKVFCAKILKPWMEAVDAAALQMSETVEIPYWQRKERQGRRSVRDVQQAYMLINTKFPNFNEKAMLSCTTLSISKAGEALAKISGIGPTAAEREVVALLESVIDRGEPSVYLDMIVDKTKRKKATP